jgi:hypothetical protein
MVPPSPKPGSDASHRIGEIEGALAPGSDSARAGRGAVADLRLDGLAPIAGCEQIWVSEAPASLFSQGRSCFP